MKKVLCIILAALMAGAMLQGCGSKSDAANTPQPAETETAVSPEALIPEETAYEGVRRYCRIEYGRELEEDELSARLEMGEATESEYRVIFHSYTGAVVTFFVEKSGGRTRMVEYVPALDIENEAGTFDLLDYLEEENASDPPSEDDVPNPAEEADEPQSHYVFQPKVCSVYMEEVFGKTMCETWYHLVDAVMAGEDTFACPDQHTYDWVMGQFPERCFPVLTELIDLAWDRENSVVDGVASFTWLVPPEESAVRIAEFAAQIEGILNDALEDDYSDLEKALALYDYFSQHYEYDYATFERMYEEYVDEVRSIRFFETGTGICQEISTAYSYLLMQAGVEATVMMGDDHQWSYVRINGHDYHIDPTFVISDMGSLSYFMMTDEQREATGFSRADFLITSNYASDHPHPDYAADDDTFRPLWDQVFGSFSHEDHVILCPKESDDGEWTYLEFDYSGY